MGGIEFKNKEEAFKEASIYLECSSFASVSKNKAGMYKVYPRCDKKKKQAFYSCVKPKGAHISEDWLKND
jgi:hypothetical protein